MFSACNMDSTFVLLLGVLLVSASLCDECYDASKQVQNGQLICRFEENEVDRSNWHMENVWKFAYTCRLNCKPGYESSIDKIECESRYQHDSPLAIKPETFEGYWSGELQDVSCTLPRSCASLEGEHPKHGKIGCSLKDDVTTCIRLCDFPYVPTQPEHTKEFCGNQTVFFWSHVLRNNKTEMPPCIVKETCDPIETVATVQHGRLKCKNGTSFKTTSCKVECDHGYIKTNEDDVTFCGPASGYRWSHEWMNAKETTRQMAECKKAPISLLFVLTDQNGNCPNDKETPLKTLLRQLDFQRYVWSYGSPNQRIYYRTDRWEVVSSDQECIESEDGDHWARIYINLKDRCEKGTCQDACSDLEEKDLTKACNEMCDYNEMTSPAFLNRQRNVIIQNGKRHFEEMEKDVIKGVKGTYTLKSMNVEVGESDYQGDVDGPYSPFCFKKE